MKNNIKKRAYLLIIVILLSSTFFASTLAILKVTNNTNNLTNHFSSTIVTLIKYYLKTPDKTEPTTIPFYKNENSFIFIFNDTGHIIAKPTKGPFKSIALTKTNKPLFESIYQQASKCKGICSLTAKMHREKNQPLIKWVFKFSKLSNPDLIIVYAIKASKLYSPSMTLFFDILIINGIVLLATILLSYFFVKKLAKPIQTLSRLMETLPRKHFVFSKKDKQDIDTLMARTDDISALTKSFVDLGKELTKYIKNLQHTTTIKERILNELKIAKAIQQSMLPEKNHLNKPLDNIEAYAIIQSARQVAGDFYDFAFLNDNLFYFLIGDVSDKGVAASLFMAVTKTLIAAEIKLIQDPGKLLTQVNKELYLYNRSNMFVTLFICTVNTVTGDAVYSNAGHLPPIIRHRNGSIKILEIPPDPILGAFPETRYTSQKLVLKNQDFLFTYTDGLTEAINSKQEMFGEQRIVSFIKQKFSTKGLKKFNNLLLNKLIKHCDKKIQDDITMVSIFFNNHIKKHQDINWISLAPELKSIKKALALIEAELKNVRFNKKQKINTILLATEEALVNIISYSNVETNPEIVGREIFLGTDISKHDRAIIYLMDKGIPFDPTSVSIPKLEETLETPRKGGFGCYLINTLVDDWKYKREDGKNILTLFFYLDDKKQKEQINE